MNRRQVLATLGSVVGGGCLRLSPSGSSSPTATPASTGTRMTDTGEPSTATSTPETADTSGETMPSYPNGLSADGVTEFLYPLHERALETTSFRARWSKLDRTNSYIKWKKQYRADPDAALGTWTRRNGGAVEMYRADGKGLWRETIGDRQTFGNDGRHNWGKRPSTWGVELAPFIVAADWSAPVRVNEDRPAVWEVTAEGVANPSSIPGYHPDGTVLAIPTASMTVDENGVIRSVTADYRVRAGLDSQEIVYSIDFTIDSLGSVSVSEPEWVPTANQRVPTVSASLTDGGRYVRVVIESGNRIEPNSRISVFNVDDDTKFVVQLDEPVEPDTPAFLYTTESESAFTQGAIARGSRPADSDAISLTDEYEVAAFRKATQYFQRVPVS